MFCSKCGNNVQESDEFCAHCGATLPATVSVVEENKVRIVRNDIDASMNGVPGEVAALGGALDNLSNEADRLLSVYDNETKKKLEEIKGQHLIAGVIVGPIPAMGLLGLANAVIMFYRMGDKVNVNMTSQVQKFDKLFNFGVSSGLSALGWFTLFLVPIKALIAFMEFTGIGLPPALVIGGLSGYVLTNMAGSSYINKVRSVIESETTAKKKKKKFLGLF